MAHTKLFTGIYVVLFAIATVQVAVEGRLENNYWPIFWFIMVLSFVKAVMVAWYYQHLKWEPRSVAYLALGGLLAVIALTSAATYSIVSP